MNSFTRLPLFALALAALCATTPAEAQTARKTTPARPAATAARPASTAARSTAARPATASTAAKPAARPAPAATAAAATEKPAEVAAPAKSEPVVARKTSTSTTSRSTMTSRSSAPARSSVSAKYLNAGVGLAAYYGGGLPLGASFEVEIKDNLSVGGSIDYLRYGYNSGGYKWNYTFIYAGARASYHLGDLLNVGNDKFDPYVGATLGFRYAGYKDNYGYNDYYSSPYNSGLFLGVHLGSRYMFSEKIGGFAEVGYGVSALRLGLTAKF